MMKYARIFLVVSAILMLMSSFIDDDFTKFMLTGHSGTHGVELIHPSRFWTYGMVLCTLLLTLYSRRSKAVALLSWISLVVLLLTLRTYAVEKPENYVTVVSGLSIFPLHSWQVTTSDACPAIVCCFLDEDVERAVQSFSPASADGAGSDLRPTPSRATHTPSSPSHP